MFFWRKNAAIRGGPLIKIAGFICGSNESEMKDVIRGALTNGRRLNADDAFKELSAALPLIICGARGESSLSFDEMSEAIDCFGNVSENSFRNTRSALLWLRLQLLRAQSGLEEHNDADFVSEMLDDFAAKLNVSPEADARMAVLCFWRGVLLYARFAKSRDDVAIQLNSMERLFERSCSVLRKNRNFNRDLLCRS